MSSEGEKPARRNWDRHELLVALKLYFELDFGKFHSGQPDIIQTSSLIGRTAGAVAMKLSNFASLDPAMQGKGLPGVSKADTAIMQEFLANPEVIFLAAQEAYDRASNQTPYGLSDVQEPFLYDFDQERETETLATVKVRTVQNLFRKAVIASYHNTCAVCRMGVPDLLVASHIIPWSQDPSKRMHPTNGISLCSLHDRAFDRGYISLTNDYMILVSKKLNSHKGHAITKTMFHDFDQKSIHLPFRFAPEPRLRTH